MSLPRILIIDDLFGRVTPGRPNEDRANLCGQYLLRDISGDQGSQESQQRILKPRAEAVFYRGQTPIAAGPGDCVENNLEGCVGRIREGWDPSSESFWSLVLLDLCFYTGDVTEESHRRTPGMPEGREHDAEAEQYFGLHILARVQKDFPDLPVVIFSSKSRETVSKAFTSKGALGFLARESLHSPELLDDYIWRHGLIVDESEEIIGKSKALLFALRDARRLSSQRQSLLIRGERGSGKELLARYIHSRSGRGEAKRPFIEVNSAAFSPQLFASELFGIEARTATGVSERSGLIQSANGGDLFFDEIADMPIEVQAGILRVIQEKRVVSVGGVKPVPIDVRFISATNAILEQRDFRSDLLDRLRDGGTITLPPLRDRPEDIPLLVERFVRDAETVNAHALRRKVSGEATDLLTRYSWPGNVRELRSIVFDAVNSHPDVEHLVPVHLRIPGVRPGGGARLNVAPRDARPQGLNVDSDLQTLIQGMSHLILNARDPHAWAGQWPEVQSAYAHMAATLLKAALDATRRPTPENPAGDILIHPAVKLMTGNRKCTASQAADLIKKLLGLSAPDKEQILKDPTLREAHETALRLRPSKPRSRSGKTKS